MDSARDTVASAAKEAAQMIGNHHDKLVQLLGEVSRGKRRMVQDIHRLARQDVRTRDAALIALALHWLAEHDGKPPLNLDSTLSRVFDRARAIPTDTGQGAPPLLGRVLAAASRVGLPVAAELLEAMASDIEQGSAPESA